METPVLLKREDFAGGRHRASSDPLSRGGAFLDGAGLLNQEPNPFEQSFGPLAGSAGPKASDGSASASGRRARSTSPSSLMPRATPGGTQRLPPLSLMQTPGGELSAFGWGVDSLRTGPLSPALLNAPTGTSGLYDPSALGGRTGLTPLVAGAAGAGATPAGAAGAVSFPPPSPATAALFAMMTNNTPGTSDAAANAAALAGGGPRPHEGPNEANSFEASFARANSDNAVTSGASKRAADALHRSALQNHMNGIGGSAPAVPQLSSLNPRPASTAPAPPPPGTYAQPPGPPPHTSAYYPPPNGAPAGYAPAPPGSGVYPSAPAVAPGPLAFVAPPPPSNPLDLLTAASNYNDDAVVAAAALSGLATPGGGFPAAAILAAQQAQAAQQQQQQQQHAGAVMPGSTVSGGPGALGTSAANGGPEGSPAPANGRAKRGAAAQQPVQAAPAPPAKRARKQTAAAAAAIAAEAGGLDEDDEMMLAAGGGAAGAKKAPAKRGRKASAAATITAAKKEENMDDGGSVGTSADGDAMMYGYDDMGPGELEGSQPPEAPKKGGRGRKKDTGETEEEKRRNFLERNRQAALKCRQRKKAWLQSLQTKVELLTTDNDALQSTVNNLKEEVHSLRAILAAHANCPVALGNVPNGPPPMPPHMHPRGMPGPPPQGMPPSSIPPPGYAPRAQY
ncbi:Transcription factor [Rhodotorula kratochvilovae]